MYIRVPQDYLVEEWRQFNHIEDEIPTFPHAHNCQCSNSPFRIRSPPAGRSFGPLKRYCAPLMEVLYGLSSGKAEISQLVKRVFEMV